MNSDSAIESVERKYEVEFLLHQHDYLAESFWKNEETGETRLRFFIALVTAVLALVGAMLSSKSDIERLTITISISALVSLVTMGLALLLRMIRRNEVTDGYKLAMDMIRLHFLKFGTGNLSGFDPFGVDRTDDTDLSTGSDATQVTGNNKKLKRRFLTGGLVETVILLNGLLIAALAILVSSAAFPSLRLGIQAVPWLLGLLSLMLATYLQYAYVWRRRRVNDARLRSRSDQFKDRLFDDKNRQRQ